MHNTILLTITMMLTSVSASAQFYTITKESEISGKIDSKTYKTTEIPIDTLSNIEPVVPEIRETEIEENSGESILNARKSDDYKSQDNEILPVRKIEVTQQIDSSRSRRITSGTDDTEPTCRNKEKWYKVPQDSLGSGNPRNWLVQEFCMS